MKVAVVRETTPGERRVALVPEAVAKLRTAGFEVLLESGAGDRAWLTDDAFAEAGASGVGRAGGPAGGGGGAGPAGGVGRCRRRAHGGQARRGHGRSPARGPDGLRAARAADRSRSRRP